MSKAVATHTLVIVIIIGLSLFAALAIFFKWLDISGIQTTEASCRVKLVSYCVEWWKKDFREVPFNWNEREPLECGRDCGKPEGERRICVPQPDQQQCKNILQIPD